MAYPNFYSAPNNFQAPQQPQYQQPIVQSNVIWVQSESGAKAFPQGVNCNTILLDSEGDYFYIKSTDMSGMPKLRKFAYKEVTGEAENTPSVQQSQTEYVTREEFEKFKSEYHKPHYNNKNNYKKEDRANE